MSGGNFPTICAECINKARAAYKKNRLDEALEAALQGFDEAPTPEEEIELSDIVTRIQLRKGQYSVAEAFAEKRLKLVLKTGNNEEIYDAYFYLGKVYARAENHREAREAWEKALKLAIQIKDKKIEGRTLLNLAILDQDNGEYSEALEVLERIQELLKETDDLRGQITCISRIIYSLTRLEHFEEALKLTKALENISKELGNPQIEASVAFRVASVYLAQDKFKQAKPHVDKAIKLFRELGDRKNLLISLCEACRIAIELGNWKELDVLLNAAGELAETQAWQNKILLVLAEAEAWKGNKEKAVGHYRDAFDQAVITGTAHRLIAFHISIKDTLKKEKLNAADDKVKSLLERAQTVYKKHGLLKEAIETKKYLQGNN